MQRRRDNAKGTRPGLVMLSISLLITLGLIFGVVYVLLTGIVEHQAAQYGLSLNAMYVKNVQAIGSAVKSLFDQITLDGPLANLLYYRTREAGDLLIGLRQLDAYRRSNPLIDSIYLYNALNDTFYISSDHSIQAEQPRHLMFDYGVDEILNNLDQYDNMQPIVREVTVAYPRYGAVPYVTFLRYSTLSQGTPNNVIIINVRQDTIFRYISAAEDTADATILFMQGDDVLFSAFDLPKDMGFIDQAVRSERDSGYYLDDSGALVCYDKSFSPYWWILSRNDIDQITAALHTDASLTRIQILIALLLVVMFVSGRLISKWVKLFRERTKALQAAEAEKRLLMAQQRRQSLLRLINTRIQPGDAAADTLLAAAEIPPVAGRHCLVLLVPHGMERLLRTVGFAEGETLLQAMGRAIAEGLFSHSPLFTVATEKHRFVTVLRPGPDADALQTDILALQEALAQRWPLTVAAIISDGFESASGIADAYAWTLEAMAYLQLLPPDACLTHEEITRREAQDVPYPDALVRVLVAALMQRNEEEATQRLMDALNALSAGSYRSFQIGLSQLLSTLDEAIATLQANNGIRQPASLGGLWYAVSGQQAVADIYATLRRSIQEALAGVQRRDATRQEDLVQSMEACIGANYTHPDFSQADIAEALGLSIAHLSKLYKKERGSTLAEAIQGARMARAVHLLETTGLQVGVIAREAGFTEPQYFYRVFKKTMGTTPSQYRQNKRADAQSAPQEADDA